MPSQKPSTAKASPSQKPSTAKASPSYHAADLPKHGQSMKSAETLKEDKNKRDQFEYPN